MSQPTISPVTLRESPPFNCTPAGRILAHRDSPRGLPRLKKSRTDGTGPRPGGYPMMIDAPLRSGGSVSTRPTTPPASWHLTLEVTRTLTASAKARPARRRFRLLSQPEGRDLGSPRRAPAALTGPDGRGLPAARASSGSGARGGERPKGCRETCRNVPRTF